MFAREQKQEYDPTSTPVIERPLAGGRPLNTQANSHASAGKTNSGVFIEGTMESTNVPVYSPSRPPTKFNVPELPNPQVRGQNSPSKSSLSKNSRYAQASEAENAMWVEEEESFLDRHLPAGKSLHRHAKSVTFDAAPPEVNEYEMQTPDPSSVASSSRHGSYDSANDEEDESFDRASAERDDSFDASLEDADKTPVVLPEDWRFMSPAAAHDGLAKHFEDPFDGEKSSPSPAAIPATSNARGSPTRTDSVNSNGSERRPLPPLPALGMPMFPRARSDSNNSLLAAAERVSSAQRMFPSPPRPASISKSELLGIGSSSMPIEDRLRLMMIQDTENVKNPVDEQRERRMRRGKSPEHGNKLPDDIKIHEDANEDEADDVADLGEYKLPPRISRESILRKVKSRTQLIQQEEYDYSSPVGSPAPEPQKCTSIDPDVPLPSLEDSTTITETELEESIIIKQEEDIESEVDVYSIPDMYRLNLHIESVTQDSTNINNNFGSFNMPGSYVDSHQDEDEESQYSTDLNGEHKPPLEPQSSSATEDEGPPTPRAQSPQQNHLHKAESNSRTSHRLSLGQFASMLGEDDFGLGLQSYLTPTPPVDEEPLKAAEAPVLKRNVPLLKRPVTPPEQLSPPRFPGYVNDDEEEPKTPDSVIRHPIVEPPLPESPGISASSATIKASGARLKTRCSMTPADISTMAETRRQVSGERPMPPTISEDHQQETSSIYEDEKLSRSCSSDASSEGDPVKQIKRKSSLVQLEVPVESIDEGLSINLDKEFDRVIEAQKVAFNHFFTNSAKESNSKSSTFSEAEAFDNFNQYYANISTRKQKGYLMRQNTKMVVASSASNDLNGDDADSLDTHTRGTRSAGNSPRKPSHTQTWTTEPWNGKIRRKSIRQSAGSPQKRGLNGPVPPMPGQQSNVTSGLDSVAENGGAAEVECLEDGDERGRLFVKVVGVKELDLPIPRGKLFKSVLL